MYSEKITSSLVQSKWLYVHQISFDIVTDWLIQSRDTLFSRCCNEVPLPFATSNDTRFFFFFFGCFELLSAWLSFTARSGDRMWGCFFRRKSSWQDSLWVESNNCNDDRNDWQEGECCSTPTWGKAVDNCQEPFCVFMEEGSFFWISTSREALSRQDNKCKVRGRLTHGVFHLSKEHSYFPTVM